MATILSPIRNLWIDLFKYLKYWRFLHMTHTLYTCVIYKTWCYSIFWIHQLLRLHGFSMVISIECNIRCFSKSCTYQHQLYLVSEFWKEDIKMFCGIPNIISIPSKCYCHICQVKFGGKTLNITCIFCFLKKTNLCSLHCVYNIVCLHCLLKKWESGNLFDTDFRLVKKFPFRELL